MKKLTLFILSLTAIVSFSAFGSVKSLSSAWQTTRANGDVVDTITITCARKEKKFFIQKEANSRTWCSEKFDVKCSSNKINVAKKLCSLSQREIDAVVGIDADATEPVVANAAEVEVAAPVDDIDVSEQRKMDLQEQLILIEESRLNIQAKMLELEKAEIALRSN